MVCGWSPPTGPGSCCDLQSLYLTREINYCWQMSRSKGEVGGCILTDMAALPARGHYVWPRDARRGGAPCLHSATPPWSSSLVSNLYPHRSALSPAAAVEAERGVVRQNSPVVLIISFRYIRAAVSDCCIHSCTARVPGYSLSLIIAPVVSFCVMCFLSFDWIFIVCESSDEWQVGTGSHFQLRNQKYMQHCLVLQKNNERLNDLR